MSFISIAYILFLSIVSIIYFSIPYRFRWILLLISSYVFYSFSKLEYVLLIVFSTLVDYLVARALSRLAIEKQKQRFALLSLSIIVNLGVLIIFKYFNFFSSSTSTLLMNMGLEAPLILHQWVLPVGISFYTFQSMAYTIDVYRNRIPVEHHLGIFATYIALFPQLVAGPIERAQNIIPQLRVNTRFEYDRVVSGLRTILWGVFLKVVIADNLAIYVNTVYNNAEDYSGLPLLVSTFFFTFQIYCDFNGYTQIAIGSARILGFELMQNFDAPYHASSIRDFWRRWHISLSTWFRDYLYIPLGGNRASYLRRMFNLFIVFVLSGLWHGANWTFVIWGALHGLYVMWESTLDAIKMPSLGSLLFKKYILRLITFCAVWFAWIFFRANNIEDALYIIENLFNFSDGRELLLSPYFNLKLDPRLQFMSMFALIGFLMIADSGYLEWIADKLRMNTLLRWSIYLIAAYLTLASLLYNGQFQEPFIYFQF